MDKLNTTLLCLSEENGTENILDLLKSLNPNEIRLNSSSSIKSLLKYKNKLIILKTTELVAELAKDESNRNVLSEKEILQLLLNLLESDESINLNVIRALGNIFFENEDATNMLEKNDFDKILNKFYDLEGSDNILLLSKISGLLLNIFISNGDLKFVNKNQLLNHISSILEKQSSIKSDDIKYFSYLLQIIYTLMVEYEDQIIYSEKLYNSIIDILKNSNIPELELICLQILYNASDTDKVQFLLAKLNVCEKIFELIEKYKGLIEDEESRSILKMACDLINNILIEDESMQLLYNEGQGKVYKNCVQWLDSTDEDLLATAIMAIGNFARNDKNCISIVKGGISKKLIELLPKYVSKNPNIKLLHGLLSTLKNLVVPKINKAIILEEGLLTSIEPVLEMDEDIVIFKLLGTLRLLIDGQETAARNMISKKLFIEKLVRWFSNTHHLGVKLEVSRLLAWLIKNCHSWESMQYILKTDGAVACLVSMFSSEDVIMENEALFSLNLLAISIIQCSDITSLKDIDVEKNKAEFVKQIVEADIASVLPYMRIFSHSEQMLENLIGLLEKLLVHQDILNHFVDKKAANTLIENMQMIKYQNCLEKLQKVISLVSL
ncbi:rap1 GTPase-GDP dissociation stimulator 1-B [Coccinella septempunctata]|uniref:rap1 GTPase-GDP dissociation stimulator 1-B n=1 Tax=Coccinella septempunctata TaxID=41139 RepID=UPI001D089D40|nr:rap1 GTPase-GDP dissociation stimulator 1-B [Coccinella septempunctata]